MVVLAILLLLAIGCFLVSSLLLVVTAFRVNIWWGLGSLLLWPIKLAFAIVHWQLAKNRFLAMMASVVAAVAIVAAMCVTDPQFVESFKKGYADARAGRRSAGSDNRQADQPPREARDLADPQSGPAAAQPRPAASPVDPYAAERAALAKHAAELNATYVELNKERGKLKKNSPQVAAFNAKAASYQAGLGALADEQARLAALDHPSLALTAPVKTPAAANSTNPTEAQAAAALAQLRIQASQCDYPAFAETLKKCLADYRQTAAYPQIVSTARGTLSGATPEKLAASIQARGSAVKAEIEAAMTQIRTIVNQVPPTVPKPARGAEVYHYAFHPGAQTPDYATADLVSTREPWKGDFVYMDTAPGIYYRSADCEFNPQTKFFFTNRDVPKKKLTDAETAAVVGLYRTIAADQRILAGLPQRLQESQAASATLLALNKEVATTR